MEQNSSPESNSSTLFVSDIPPHLQEREFTTLFSSCDGFVSARLRQDRNENIVGFVDFDEHSSAATARERFQDYKFNPLTEQGISVHFSQPKTRSQKSNNRFRSKGSRPWKPRSDNSYYSPFQHPSFTNTASMNYPPLPSDASSTLYVEGLPLDATEREVAHIFRPWAGFQSIRLTTKESKQYSNRMYILCFAEFDNKYQSTIAIQALQGYKMDKHDYKGLSISYAKSEKTKGDRKRTNGEDKQDKNKNDDEDDTDEDEEDDDEDEDDSTDTKSSTSKTKQKN